MLRRVLLASLTLPALLLAAPLKVGKLDEPPKEVTCKAAAGFRGCYRPGGWVAVRLRLENTTDDDAMLRPSAVLPLGEDWASTAFEGAPVDLPHGALKTGTLYVHPVEALDAVQVHCLSPHGLTVCAAMAPMTAVAPGRAFLVLTGPCGLSALAARQSADAAVQVDPKDLPERPEGYDGVDWAVLRGAEWASDPVCLEALTRWLEGGGRLAVSGAEALRALAASSLGRRLGVSLGEPGPVASIGGLRTLAGEDLKLPSGGALCESIVCPRAGAVPGTEGLVIRAGLGAGEVLLFALDPEVFRGQPGYWGLWARTLGLPAKPPPEDSGSFPVTTPPLAWARDVLASALYHKEPIRLDWIWGFLGVYLVVVGPADYFLVRKLRRWRLAGLLTLGSWAVLASLACYHLGSSGRFSRTVVSRVAVMDAFPGAGRVSGRSLVSLYQSGNARFDAGAPWGEGSGAVVMDPAELAKSGLLKGEGLSWTEGRTLVANQVPVYVGTQKVFEARWQGDWKSLGIGVERTPAGWRLSNRSKSALQPAGGGPAILPGASILLGAPAPPGRLETGSTAQELLGAWLSNSPEGLPLVLGQRVLQPCFSFWMEGEGIPLGIAGAYPAVRQEAVLLRIYPG